MSTSVHKLPGVSEPRAAQDQAAAAAIGASEAEIAHVLAGWAPRASGAAGEWFESAMTIYDS